MGQKLVQTANNKVGRITINGSVFEMNYFRCEMKAINGSLFEMTFMHQEH